MLSNLYIIIDESENQYFKFVYSKMTLLSGKKAGNLSSLAAIGLKQYHEWNKFRSCTSSEEIWVILIKCNIKFKHIKEINPLT